MSQAKRVTVICVCHRRGVLLSALYMDTATRLAHTTRVVTHTHAPHATPPTAGPRLALAFFLYVSASHPGTATPTANTRHAPRCRAPRWRYFPPSAHSHIRLISDESKRAASPERQPTWPPPLLTANEALSLHLYLYEVYALHRHQDRCCGHLTGLSTSSFWRPPSPACVLADAAAA